MFIPPIDGEFGISNFYLFMGFTAVIKGWLDQVHSPAEGWSFSDKGEGRFSLAENRSLFS